jgi:glycosyltransferase involved in cell wall biosynthesis
MIDVRLIVNVFNGEKYLEQTLVSLINQTYRGVSIHCFDNHSTDRTLDILEQVSALNDNIFIYKTPKHIPLVQARNYAIKIINESTKKPFYFGFCDADDLWDQCWVSSLMNVSASIPDILICNGATIKNSEISRFSSCLSMTRLSPFYCPVAQQSCLYNSDLYNNKLPFFDEDLKIIHDTEFWIRKRDRLTYVHISDYLFFYRIHSSSMVQTHFFKIIKERWIILKKHNLSKIRFCIDLLKFLLSGLVGKN